MAADPKRGGTKQRPAAIIDLAGRSLGREVQKQERKRRAKREALGLNPEAERSLLGAMLLSYEAYAAAIDVLVPTDFATPANVTVFDALGSAARADDGGVDLVMLNEELKRMGALAEVGGSAYTGQLVNTCPNWQGYREYLQIVLDCSLNRMTQAIGAQLFDGLIAPSEAQMALEALQARREVVLEGAGVLARALPGVVASSVATEPSRGRWRRRLARGKLTILDGDPGLGKGHLTIDIAARKSSGRAFPGDAGVTQEPGAVILISPEDDLSDTLRPRLEAAGANLDAVHILNTLAERDATTGRESERSVTIPRDLATIERLVTATKAELLIIDPIMGALDPGVKTGVDSEVRAAVMPLKHLATRLGIAVLLVRHLNKSGGDKAIYRGGGSIAFTGICRLGLMLAEHPDNDGKRVLLPVKNNLSKEADGLAFALASDDPDGVAWVSWDREPVQISADDVLGNGGKDSGEARAVIAALRSLAEIKQLPAKISDIITAMGKDPHDDKDYSRIARRVQRMAKAGRIAQPEYGKYGLKV